MKKGRWPFRARRDREFEDEIQAHLDMAARDRVERGDTPEAARLAARREFGNQVLVKEVTREMWGWSSVDALGRDIRDGWRMLRRTPGFTMVVVLLLALGIGANTAIFTVINALMLRQLPVHEPGQLVELLSRYPGSEPRMNYFSWSHYEHYRDRNHSFSDLIGMSPARFDVTRDGLGPDTVDGDYVVGTFFPALGIHPAIGRLLDPADDQLGAGDPAVVVLSWSYWEARFNKDPSILGTRLDVSGVPATIVGVAPFEFFGLMVGRAPALWMPAAMESLVQHPSRRADGTLGLALMGRLKPGVSLEQALTELRALDRFRVEDIATRSNDPQWRQATLELEPAGSGFSRLRDQFAGQLLLLMGIVALLLLIACTNVASMLAARAAARQREIAVRVALGAGRLRLIRQLFIESLLLSSAGGLLGVVLAHAGADALVRAWPVDPRSGLQRFDISLEPDLRVLLFTAGVALVAAVLSGLAPAWNAFASAASSSLREIGAAAETKRRRLFGKSLVVAQVALSMVLLSAAVLLVGHVSSLRSRDLGFERDSVLLVTLDPAPSGYTRDHLFRLYRDLLERFEVIPGVRSATLAAVTPIQGGEASRFVLVDGVDEDPDARRRVSLNWVAPGYFETFGTPRIAGRDFMVQDEGAPRVAIVNQRLARHYFGDTSAIGRRFTFEDGDQTYEIVGVVADAKYASLHHAAPPTIYLHAFQEGRGRFSQFALRTAVPPASIAGDVRRAVSDVSTALPIGTMGTLAEQLDRSIPLERMTANLSSAFGGLGALLTAIGLYGLLAYTVARRTNEIGIRIVLGASRHDVTRMVLTSALALVSMGLLLGTPLAFWSHRFLATLVTDLDGTLGVPVAGAAVAMIILALVAAYLPARRAARVQPAEALRHS